MPHSRRDFLLAIPLLAGRGPRMLQTRFDTVRNGRSHLRLLHIHGDETPSREAMVTFVREAGGVAFAIDNSERTIPGESGRLDPNRMFSRDGAERNLWRLNPRSPAASVMNDLLRLDKDRPKFIRQLLPPRGGLLIAMHNNSRGYSMETEIPISDKVAKNDASGIHQFMLATNEADYEVLAKSTYNVVLQKTLRGEEDGSLSRLCTRLGVRYVNIEAAMEEGARQLDMLRWTAANLLPR